MKIGTITFHSSYNFGSNLQAYALQKFVCSLNEKIEYKIINLRTKEQDEINQLRYTNRVKNIVKSILFKKVLDRRSEVFERFINTKLNLTKKYSTKEEFHEDKECFDFYISGSDQLWNTTAFDFNWLNYLDGVKSKNKISYAASFGPLSRNTFYDNKDKIQKNLKEFKAISVREEKSKEIVEECLNENKKITINVDPTMLLTKEEWITLMDNKPIVDGDYIFYYTLKPSKERVIFLKKLSKEMKMKVVVAAPSFKYEIFSGFIKKYESGPKEFLNLIYYSKLVVSTSFHGNVFSIIFNKPFYAIDGMSDNRISHILKLSKLENRSITINDDIRKLSQNYDKIDFSNIKKFFEEEKEKSKQFFIDALELKK